MYTHHQVHKFANSYDAQNFWRKNEHRGIPANRMRTRGFPDKLDVWVYVFPC